jgi:WD40 repeat protein
VTDPVQPAVEGDPQIGVPGGLAAQTENGIVLWDIASGEVITLESDGLNFAHDVHEEQLLWCALECTELIMTDTSTLERLLLGRTEVNQSYVGQAHLSPDGRRVAALVGEEGNSGARAVAIWDIVTQVAAVVSDPETSVDYLTWSPDGDQLFATSSSYGGSSTVVWRYQVSDQEFSAVVLPFSGAMNSVAVDAKVAGSYITGNAGEMSDCRAPTIQPSGRTETCTFGF